MNFAARGISYLKGSVIEFGIQSNLQSTRKAFSYSVTINIINVPSHDLL